MFETITGCRACGGGELVEVLAFGDMPHSDGLLTEARVQALGTCSFTRDGEAARHFTDNIRVGMVGVNVPLPVSIRSFGGWTRSLFEDLYACGPDSVRFYTRRKTLTQGWVAGGRPAWGASLHLL